jgi:hypothetical protein
MAAISDRKIFLNELNDEIADLLKENARQFNKYFQDEAIREDAERTIQDYSSNLFKKNAELSQKYRKMGNELFNDNRFMEALDPYNQVILLFIDFNLNL